MEIILLFSLYNKSDGICMIFFKKNFSTFYNQIGYDCIKATQILKSVNRFTFTDDFRERIEKKVSILIKKHKVNDSTRIPFHSNDSGIQMSEFEDAFLKIQNECDKYDSTETWKKYNESVKNYLIKYFPGISKDLLFLDDKFSKRINSDHDFILDEIKNNFTTFGLILFPFPIPNFKYIKYFCFCNEFIKNKLLNDYFSLLKLNKSNSLSFIQYISYIYTNEKTKINLQEKMINLSLLLYKEMSLLNLEEEIKNSIIKMNHYFHLTKKYRDKKRNLNLVSPNNLTLSKEVIHLTNLIDSYSLHYDFECQKMIFLEKLVQKGLHPSDFFHVGLPVNNLNQRGLSEFQNVENFKTFLYEVNKGLMSSSNAMEKNKSDKNKITKEEIIKFKQLLKGCKNIPEKHRTGDYHGSFNKHHKYKHKKLLKKFNHLNKGSNNNEGKYEILTNDPFKKIEKKDFLKSNKSVIHKKTDVFTYYYNEIIKENTLFLQWFNIPEEEFALMEIKLKYLSSIFGTMNENNLIPIQKEKILEQIAPLHVSFFKQINKNSSFMDTCYRALIYEWFYKISLFIEQNWARKQKIYEELSSIKELLKNKTGQTEKKIDQLRLISFFEKIVPLSFSLSTSKGNFCVPTFHIEFAELLKGESSYKDYLYPKLADLISTYNFSPSYHKKYSQDYNPKALNINFILSFYSSQFGIKASNAFFYINYISLANLLGIPMDLVFNVENNTREKKKKDFLTLNKNKVFCKELVPIVTKQLHRLMHIRYNKEDDNSSWTHLKNMLSLQQNKFQSDGWNSLIQDNWKSFVGKKGIFRGSIYSKRANYTARAVISSDSNLNLTECVLPSTIIANLFYPIVIRRMKWAFLDYIDKWNVQFDEKKYYIKNWSPKSLQKYHNCVKVDQKLVKELVSFIENALKCDPQFDQNKNFKIPSHFIKVLNRCFKKEGFISFYKDDLEKKKSITEIDQEKFDHICYKIQNSLVLAKKEKELLLHYLANECLKRLNESEQILDKLLLLLKPHNDDIFWHEIIHNRYFYDYFSKLISKYYIILNRQPSLHRLSIQSFKPKIGSESSVIRINPLVCPPFNADFDGDTMSVFLPHTLDAQLDASMILGNHNNIITPGTNKAIITPTLDLLFGLYYLSQTPIQINDKIKNVNSLEEFNEVYNYYSNYKEKTRICITYKGIKTTIGRTLIYFSINHKYYVDFHLVNTQMNKKNIALLVKSLISNYGLSCAAAALDILHSLGSYWAFKSGLTVNYQDFIVPYIKTNLMNIQNKKDRMLSMLSNQHWITQIEHNSMLDKSESLLIKRIMTNLMHDVSFKRDESSSFKPGAYMLIDSGSRGSMNQLKQLCGIKGYVMGASGSIIPKLIMGNLKEGFSEEEFFLSSLGGRKGIVDRALNTSETGYLYRKLHYGMKELTITGDDCGNLLGFLVGEQNIGLKETSFLLKSDRFDHLEGRILAKNVYSPLDGHLIAVRNQMINNPLISSFYSHHISHVFIRSPMTCGMPSGVCQKCYGADPSDYKSMNLIAKGYPIGVVAAQSMGEPATQLTMRTFHQGGSVEKQIKSSENEVGIFSEVEGTVIYQEILLEKNNCDHFLMNDNHPVGINQSYSGYLLIINSFGSVLQSNHVPFGSYIYVEDGQTIEKNTLLCQDFLFEKPIKVYARFDFIVSKIEYYSNPLNPFLSGIAYISVPYMVGKKIKYYQTFWTFLHSDKIHFKENEYIRSGRLILESSYSVEPPREELSGYKKIIKILQSSETRYQLPVALFDGYVSFGNYDLNDIVLKVRSDVFCTTKEEACDLSKSFSNWGVKVCSIDKQLKKDQKLRSKGSSMTIKCFLEKKYLISKKYLPYLKVRHGSYVEEGMSMMNYIDSSYLKEYVAFYGIEGAWEMIGRQIISIYQSAGVHFNPIHMECLIKQLTDVRICFNDKTKKLMVITLEQYLKREIHKVILGDPTAFGTSYASYTSIGNAIQKHHSFFSVISYQSFRQRMAKAIKSKRYIRTINTLYDVDSNIFATLPVPIGSTVLSKWKDKVD